MELFQRTPEWIRNSRGKQAISSTVLGLLSLGLLRIFDGLDILGELGVINKTHHFINTSIDYKFSVPFSRNVTKGTYQYLNSKTSILPYFTPYIIMAAYGKKSPFMHVSLRQKHS